MYDNVSPRASDEKDPLAKGYVYTDQCKFMGDYNLRCYNFNHCLCGLDVNSSYILYASRSTWSNFGIEFGMSFKLSLFLMKCK